MKANNRAVKQISLTLVAYNKVQIRLAISNPNWEETLREVGHAPTVDDCVLHWATSVHAVIFARTHRIVQRSR
jgi:hypothetical protein